jgi:hypothetical protein
MGREAADAGDRPMGCSTRNPVAGHASTLWGLMKKLNLGCGQNKIPGYINVDKYDSFQPDIVWDLEIFPWPFEDNSVSEIVMHHSLEHMGASTDCFLSIIKELYRISAPGAQIHIDVPHPRSDSFTGDPTHVRAINSNVLALFSKKENARSKALGWANTPLGVYLDVDFDVAPAKYNLSPHWAKAVQSGQLSNEELDFAISTYFNVVDGIALTMTAVK